MPIFGEYESIGEPHSVSRGRDYVSTIWRVRKTGDKNPQSQFALKCLAPRQSSADNSGDELAADRGLDFIAAIKQVKKAQSQGGSGLALIYDFGTSDQGAWYVTDFCERYSLKALVTRQGQVDDAALCHVIQSVVTGCLALKKFSHRSHGNLKLSNVLRGGKTQALRQTPLMLVDPMPLPAAEIARLENTDRHNVEKVIHDVFEVQDIKAIGELILQLVEGRVIESGFDYNYPVASSAAWERLGKRGETWRNLCNQLLDPQLSLDKISLEWLAKKFHSSSAPKNLLIALLVLAVLGATGAGIYFKVAGGFQRHLNAAQNAYHDKIIGQALTEIKAALADRPGNPAALALEKQINDLVDEQFQSAMSSANTAMATKDLDKATEYVNYALKLKTTDEGALALKSQINTAKNYQAAVEAGRMALQQGDYQKAVDEANHALGFKPKDSDASGILAAATQKINARMTADQLKQRYIEAMQAAQVAYKQGSYDDAIRQAQVALVSAPDDATAAQLVAKAKNQKSAAATKIEQAQAYQTAIQAAQTAYGQLDYGNAIKQADAALAVVPGDAKAQGIKDKAQQQAQAEKKALKNKQDYDRAMRLAKVALNGNDYDRAIKQAAAALVAEPDDAAAQAIKNKAEQQQQAALTSQRNLQNYQIAMQAAQTALSGNDYGNAIKQADAALAVVPGDAKAQGIKDKAQQQAQAEKKALKNKQDYDRAMQAAQTAFNGTDYDEAIRQANAALKFIPGDKAATQLSTQANTQKSVAVAKIEQIQKYQTAMSSATNAVNQKDYAGAANWLTNALQVKPGDTVAANYLKSAVEPELDFAADMNSARQSLTSDPANALAAAQKAVAIHSDNQEALNLQKQASQNLSSLKKLKKLDGDLAELLKRFGMSVKTSAEIQPSSTVEKFSPNIDPNTLTQYQDFVSKLEDAYKSNNWLTKERQDDLENLKTVIKNW